MANFSTNFPLYLNAVWDTKYQTQEDFFNDLSQIKPAIATDRLIDFLEYVRQNPSAVHDLALINRIFKHLDANTFQGGLQPSLARRVHELKSIFLKSIKNNNNVANQNNKEINNNNNENISDNSIQLICQADDPNDPPFFISKMLLLSASSFWRKGLSVGLNETKTQQIKLPDGIQKNARMHLAEFLKTKKIDRLHFTEEQLSDLFELAKIWQMTELLNYLSDFINIDKDNFEYCLNAALDSQALVLFKNCMRSNFEKSGFKLKIIDFDNYSIDISNLHENAEKSLDELCQFLSHPPDMLFPKVKRFEVVGRPGTNSLVKNLEFILNDQLETKLSYPQSMKDMMTGINLFHSHVSADEIIALAAQCKNLQSITLPTYYDNGTKRVHDLKLKELFKIAEECPQVCSSFKSLELYFCCIKGESLQFLKTNPAIGDRVTALHFDRCTLTNEDLKFFAEACPNLKKFHAPGYNDFTDTGLAYLSQKCADLASLDLASTQITCEGLKLLAQRCRDITYLNVTNNTEGMIDDDLETLVKAWQKLEYLYILGNKTTNKGIRAIAENCPNLKVLDLKEASLVTDLGLRHMAQGCPKIQTFTLHHNKNFTNEGFKVIAQAWSNLLMLDLSGTAITDNGLYEFAEQCPRLEILKLKWNSYPEKLIKSLKKNYPNIRIES